MTIWFLGSPSFVIIRVYSWLKNCGWISPRLFGLTLLATLPLRAQDTLQTLLDADQLRITARLDPTEPIIATQRAKLIIEIATPNWFTGGTRLGDLQVRNAIVLQRQTFGNNSNRRINGQTWAVQGWEFEIFPRYPGTYEIPGVDVSVEVADGSGGSIRGGTTTNPLTLTAIEPPVAPPAEAWVVTPDLTLRATWDLPLEDLTAGDARQRTITITAEELPAMALPTLTYGKIAGIGIYPQPARRDDQTNRGQSTATFTQTVSYFCESPGTFTLPGFTLAWWDPGSKAWQTEDIPSETFAVTATTTLAAESLPAAEMETGPPPIRVFAKRFVIISTSLFILALLLRTGMRGVGRFRARIQAKAQDRKDSEPARWNELKHALQEQDTRTMIVSLYHWRDSLPDLPGAPTLAALAKATGSTELASLFDDLLATSTAERPSPFPHGDKIAKLLAPYRHKLKKSETGVITLGIDFDHKSLN